MSIENFKIKFMYLSVFKIELFFSIASLFGYMYLGSEESFILVILMIVIGIVNIVISLLLLIKINRVYLSELFLLFGVPIIVLISFLLRVNSLSTALFSSFLAFTLPSIFIGFYLAKNQIDLFSPVLFSMFLITIGSILSIFVPFVTGVGFVVFGGASNQSASYFTSFAFGMNLYALLYHHHHQVPRYFKRRITKIILIILLPIQMIMVIIPGGRGAFVLMLVYIIVGVVSVRKNRSYRKIINYFVFVFILMLIYVIFFPILANNELLSRGYNRATAFIGTGGSINWESTSGRGILYKEALKSFSMSPIVGHGLYGYLSKINHNTYPHNIFLEILLQGGLIYLCLFIMIQIFIFRKYLMLKNINPRNIILLYIFLYPLIQLMFSGSYIVNGKFWFVITYVIVYAKQGSFNKLYQETEKTELRFH